MIVSPGSPLCPGCNKPLPTAPKTAIGRPRIYHGEECKKAYRRRNGAETAPTFSPQYGEAVAKVCDQLTAILRELTRRIRQHDDAARLLAVTPAVLKAAQLIDKGTVAHLKHNGATWKQIGNALNSNEDAVRHKYEKAGDLIERAMRIPGGELAQLVPEPEHTREKETPDAACELTAVQLVRDLLESRAKAGSKLTPRQLALRAQVSPSYMSRILSENRSPSPKILGVLLKVLLADAEADPSEPTALHELRNVVGSPHSLTPAEIAENLLIMRSGSSAREAIEVIRLLARHAPTPVLAELLLELKARRLEPERTVLLRALATETRFRIIMLINDLRALAPNQIPQLFNHLARNFSRDTLYLLNDLSDRSYAAECRTLTEAVASGASPEAISTLIRWLSTQEDVLGLADYIVHIVIRRREFPVLVKLIGCLNAGEMADTALRIRSDLVNILFEHELSPATPLPSRTSSHTNPSALRHHAALHDHPTARDPHLRPGDTH